mgnify:CR=1 FL=1
MRFAFPRMTEWDGSADLPAMAEFVVGEDAGEHGFGDRGGADADAGVVAALGADVGVFAVLRDRLALGEDRRGRLHREAGDDGLAGGDAAEDAAIVVREEFDVVAGLAHFVGIGFAGEFG